MAIDLNENYAFASTYVQVKAYKEFDLNQDNITIGWVNAYPISSYVQCSLPLNYSEYTEDFIKTTYLDLGSEYIDARNYKIQRSPINIYYPIKNSGLGISDFGRYSYWEFNEYNANDILQFSLTAPISTINKDMELSTDKHVEYFAYLKRHTNIRTYSQVSIIMAIDQPFDKYSITIIDITGGLNETITDNCLLSSGIVGSGYEQSFIINFTISNVLKNVDYAYKIWIDSALTLEDIQAQGRSGKLFVGTLFGLGIALIIRLIIHLQVGLKNPKWKLDKRNMWKQLIPIMIGGGVIGFVLAWFGAFG
jgi:hypothetical protein